MILTVLIWIALAIGITFNTLGVIGILRFPDVYKRPARSQPSGSRTMEHREAAAFSLEPVISSC